MWNNLSSYIRIERGVLLNSIIRLLLAGMLLSQVTVAQRFVVDTTCYYDTCLVNDTPIEIDFFEFRLRGTDALSTVISSKINGTDLIESHKQPKDQFEDEPEPEYEKCLYSHHDENSYVMDERGIVFTTHTTWNAGYDAYSNSVVAYSFIDGSLLGRKSSNTWHKNLVKESIAQMEFPIELFIDTATFPSQLPSSWKNIRSELFANEDEENDLLCDETFPLSIELRDSSFYLVIGDEDNPCYDGHQARWWGSSVGIMNLSLEEMKPLLSDLGKKILLNTDYSNEDELGRALIYYEYKNNLITREPKKGE